MKLRLKPSSSAAALLAVFAVSAPACGKDKPAEDAAAAVAPAEGDKPAEAKPEGEGVGGDKPAEVKAEGDKPEHERAPGEDAKGRIRAARDRVNGRRPQPLRHGVDGMPKGDGEVAGGEPSPGATGPAEPAEAPIGAGEGIIKPAAPTPGTPVVPGTPPATAPGAGTTPIPGAPAVPPAPGDPAAPGPEGIPTDPMAATPRTPGVEIRSEAGIIDAASKLTLKTVVEITGHTLAAGVPLQGIALVAGYGSVFYAAADAAKFGVALQVWQDATRRETEDRFRRMRLQYPNAQDVTALSPSKAFFSYFETIQSLTWMDAAKRMVVTVTCGESVCNQDQLARMAKTVHEQL